MSVFVRQKESEERERERENEWKRETERVLRKGGKEKPLYYLKGAGKEASGGQGQAVQPVTLTRTSAGWE